jgi:hypothetical protein
MMMNPAPCMWSWKTWANFKECRHEIVKADYQPNPFNGVVVFITGNLFVDGSPNPLKFAQVFQLHMQGAGFIIINDMFRLNVG